MSENMDSSSNVTLRMIIPGREIGVVIGKGGGTIHQIRDESEAKIFISDGSVPERVVTVTGTAEAVCMAYNLICCKLEAGEDGKQNRKENLNLRLVVAAAQCGSIIGKGGSKIKEIREMCGITVNVGSDLLPGSSERCVSVSGSREKVVECIYQIVNILASKPFIGAVVQYKPGNFVGEPYQGNNMAAYAPMGGQMGGGEGGRRGGSMGGGQMGGMGGANGMGMGGMLGAQGGGALAAFASIASSQISSGHENYVDRRGDRGERDRETTHQMTVANELIGAIIGKGGSKIAEIRQMSGANIQISKGTDKDQTNATERTINIAGSAEAVTLAKNLINMSLELHQLDKDNEGSEGGSEPRRGGGGGGGYRDNYNNYGGIAANTGLGHAANREVMQALNTLAHFNNMTHGSLFGGGYSAGMNGVGLGGRGGRQQTGARGRDDRNLATRTKFSPY